MAAHELAQVVIKTARHRLVTDYPAQIRACLDALTDEQIWWRPNEKSNSVGNLVLHVCGSIRHYLGRAVGGSDFERSRPDEFTERGPIPRADLVRLLDDTVSESARVIEGLRPERLTEVTDRGVEPSTVAALLFRNSHHLATHTGQIVYATKLLKEGAIDELWMKTNR